MRNNISNEIRQNLNEATKKPVAKKEIKNPFNSKELVDMIVDYLKKKDDVGRIKADYEEYSFISGDYIYFTVNVDGEPFEWVLALGEREDEE